MNEINTTPAQDKYEQNAYTIKRQIEDIQERLQIHKRWANGNPSDWTYAGSLGRVIELLNEVEDTIGTFSS